MTLRAALAYYIGLITAFIVGGLIDALIFNSRDEGASLLPLLMQSFDVELLALRLLYALCFYIGAFIALAEHSVKKQFWAGLAIGVLAVFQYALIPFEEPGAPKSFVPELIFVGFASFIVGANRRFGRNGSIVT